MTNRELVDVIREAVAGTRSFAGDFGREFARGVSGGRPSGAPGDEPTAGAAHGYGLGLDLRGALGATPGLPAGVGALARGASAALGRGAQEAAGAVAGAAGAIGSIRPADWLAGAERLGQAMGDRLGRTGEFTAGIGSGLARGLGVGLLAAARGAAWTGGGLLTGLGATFGPAAASIARPLAGVAARLGARARATAAAVSSPRGAAQRAASLAAQGRVRLAQAVQGVRSSSVGVGVRFARATLASAHARGIAGASLAAQRYHATSAAGRFRGLPIPGLGRYSRFSQIAGAIPRGTGAFAARARGYVTQTASGLGVGGRAAAGLGAAAGGTVLAVAAVGAAMIAIPPILRTFAERINESNRALASYNGQVAASFAQLGIGRFRRTFDTANATAGSASGLAQAVNKMEGQFQGLNILFANTKNELATAAANVAGALAEAVTPLVEIAAKILAFLVNNQVTRSVADGFAKILDWFKQIMQWLHDRFPKEFADPDLVPAGPIQVFANQFFVPPAAAGPILRNTPAF